jgi:hypothetical protein
MNANNNNHNNDIKTSVLSFDEAPASWNTRYIDPNGFECQITLRGETGSELLEKAASAIAFLLKNGCTPYVYRQAARPAPEAKNTQDTSKDTPENNGTNGTDGTYGTNSRYANPAWCPIHQCEMKRWDKNGRVWYSHKVDGQWCSGK